MNWIKKWFYVMNIINKIESSFVFAYKVGEDVKKIYRQIHTGSKERLTELDIPYDLDIIEFLQEFNNQLLKIKDNKYIWAFYRGYFIDDLKYDNIIDDNLNITLIDEHVLYLENIYNRIRKINKSHKLIKLLQVDNTYKLIISGKMNYYYNPVKIFLRSFFYKVENINDLENIYEQDLYKRYKTLISNNNIVYINSISL